MPNKFISFGLLISLTISVAQAAKPSGVEKVLKAAPFDSKLADFPASKEEDIIKNLKVSAANRKPANEVRVKEGEVKVLNELISELHGLKTSEQVQEYVDKLNANYNSYPDNVKFYVATITPMTAFRGTFYRLRQLFEKNARFQHSQVVTFAKSMATRMNVYLPLDHVKAVYEYVASPYIVNGATVTSFVTEQDVQIWETEVLLPKLTESIRRLEQLVLVKPVIWDQRIVWGPDSFQDDIGRYKQIGELEKNIAIASLYGSVSGICITRAYNVNNAIELSAQIGRLYGFDGFAFFSSLDGVSAQEITKVVKKPAFAQTGTLMPDGQDWMKLAYIANRKAVGRIKRVWATSENLRDNEDSFVFNMGYLNVNREEIGQNLELVDRIVMSKGTESLRSAVTGEVIQINYQNLFMNPPQDLKAFLPKTFVKGSNLSRSVTLPNKSMKTLTYRNYEEGRPSTWNTEVFAPYFPSIKDSADVNRTLRVLSHAGGNWLNVN